jgi:hypothetical protein
MSTPVDAKQDLRRLRSLREAAKVFFAQPGPRLVAAHAATAWMARALAGPPSLGDARALAGLALGWPLMEWYAHKHVLHAKPRQLGGGRMGELFGPRHRAHHRRPGDMELTLLPIWVLLTAMPVQSSGWWMLARRRSTALTGVAAAATAALVYEWTHFLVHTSYRPKSGLFKRLRDNHRRHHYRNENYWLAFTWPLVDRVMGTEPDPKSVPVSPTARDLYGLGDEEGTH